MIIISIITLTFIVKTNGEIAAPSHLIFVLKTTSNTPAKSRDSSEVGANYRKQYMYGLPKKKGKIVNGRNEGNTGRKEYVLQCFLIWIPLHLVVEGRTK